VYAVNENEGTVSAFRVDAKNDRLAPLNVVSAHGQGPCHLALDRTARWLAVANYGDGSLAILPVGADGRLGEAVATDRHTGSGIHPRQKGPHAHGVVFSPDNRFLLEADLGLDKIFAYRFDAARGSIAANDPPFVETARGAGPRHVVFHPSGQIVFAINELNSTVTSYHYDAKTGELKLFQTLSTLPPGFLSPNTAAEVAVAPNGLTLYASNRGNDTLALFAIDAERLMLSLIDHTPTLGQTPRHFAIDPTGAFLIVANQDSSSLMVFKMQTSTGQLRPVGRPVTAPPPTAVLMLRVK